MPGITDVPGVEVWGKGRGRFPLPCGYVDAAGATHRMVSLREIQGEEEDLMDDGELPVAERSSLILTACTEAIGDITDKQTIEAAIKDAVTPPAMPLTSSDRIAMLIYLRRVSLGNVYRFERRCPRCGFMNRNKQLDLRNLKIHRVPDDRVNKRRVEVTLPRSKRRAIVAVLSAKREARLTDLNLNQKDLRSAAILARLEAIEQEEAVSQLGRLVPEGAEADETQSSSDAEPQAVTPTPGTPPAGSEDVSGDDAKKPAMIQLDDPTVGLEVVRSLPLMDRNFLRQVYGKLEADVDTKVEVECGGRLCGIVFSFPLDLGQSFFSSPAEELSSDEALNWL